MTAKELVRLENVWVYNDGIPILEAINLSKYFGEVKAVDSLALKIKKGEILMPLNILKK